MCDWGRVPAPEKPEHAGKEIDSDATGRAGWTGVSLQLLIASFALFMVGATLVWVSLSGSDGGGSGAPLPGGPATAGGTAGGTSGGTADGSEPPTGTEGDHSPLPQPKLIDGGGYPWQSEPSVLPAGRLNLVVIQTDDQTLESLRVMPETRRLFHQGGVEFTNASANYPLCCPSRATLLTGSYSHNNGVLYNKPPTGGYSAFDGQERTLPVAMQNAGYRTIHVGKYLNGYGKDQPDEIPPGWDDWFTLVDPSSYRYFRYQVNDNGAVRRFGEAEADYQTDVLFDRALEVIEDEAQVDGPYLLMLDTLAPHVDTLTGDDTNQVQGRGIKSAIPAPRHEGTFSDESLPDDPTFDNVDGRVPSFIAERPALGPAAIDDLTNSYRAELASLMAVDEGVAQLFAAVEASGELHETAFLFLSDNGLLHGQRRMVGVKYYAWEPSVRIPLLMRLPGVTGPPEIGTPVSTVDVAATILHLGGAEPLRDLDGESLVPLISGASNVRDRSILLETGENADGLVVYQGIRTRDWKYVEYAGGAFVELFDLALDPFETRNVAGSRAVSEIEQFMEGELARLRACSGESCRNSSP